MQLFFTALFLLLLFGQVLRYLCTFICGFSFPPIKALSFKIFFFNRLQKKKKEVVTDLPVQANRSEHIKSILIFTSDLTDLQISQSSQSPNYRVLLAHLFLYLVDLTYMQACNIDNGKCKE